VSGKNEHGLTPQQERFALEVVAGRGLSEAYRLAYKTGRMKPETVHESASRLAADRKVAARVRVLQAAAADAAVLNAADILLELKKVALSDIGGIMRADGRVRLPHELDAATRAAVASFEIDEYGRMKYKFWDKNAAIGNAMKHLGLFEKDNDQKAAPLVGVVRLVALKPLKTQKEDE
jgi:phage terminase small subunit